MFVGMLFYSSNALKFISLLSVFYLPISFLYISVLCIFKEFS